MKTKLTLITIVIVITFISCQREIEPINAEHSNIDSPITRTDYRPNIVFILGDDIGYEIPTCNGGRSYSTPNIDLMAANGIRFTQCHSSPVCTTSRVMLMTGKYNFRNYTKWVTLDWNNKTFGNLLQQAGYATYMGGKWQLDGGSNAIAHFGFDEHLAYNPFNDYSADEDAGEDGFYQRYKSPKLYKDGQWLPDNITANKYGEDIFTDSAIAFMGRNKTNPFLLYYPMPNCHHPFCPTPDDPQYASWNPSPFNSDSSFFPSMVKYADKKIGQLLHALDSMELAENTIVIFMGDNGTPRQIYSQFKSTDTSTIIDSVKGQKGRTNEYGTHVPFIVQWKNHITPKVDTSLISFVDFLPTIADIAQTNIPANFGVIDGISFYPQLLGQTGTQRDYIYCWYQQNPSENTPISIWAQTRHFKEYYDTLKPKDSICYNIDRQPKENKPLDHLKPSERHWDTVFNTQVFPAMHK